MSENINEADRISPGLDDDTQIEEPDLDEARSSTSSPSEAKIARFQRTKPFSTLIHNWYIYENDNRRCKTCSTEFKGKHANLKRHLENKHPDEYKRFLEEEAKSALSTKKKTPIAAIPYGMQRLDQVFGRVREQKDGLKKDSDAYNKAVRSIAIAFAANNLSYRLIEDSLIKKMFETVSDGRLITLPRRNEISDSISNLTDELKASIKSSLESARFISITTDLWSRPSYASAFMGVTCHYFDRKLNLMKRALLACRTIDQPHTGDKIFLLYNAIISEWQIDESSILRIVTDNGSNVVKAFKESLLLTTREKSNEGRMDLPATIHIDNLDDTDIEDDSDDDDKEFTRNEIDADNSFLRHKRISCFAHNLMLAVCEAVERSEPVKAAKTKAHSLIGVISKSPRVVQALKEKTGGIGLIKPVQTRWIYWYYVFDRLINIKRSICEMCEKMNIDHDLGPVDWKLIESVKNLLAPFAAAVTHLEGEFYVTISEVYPILYSLTAKLSKEMQNITSQPIVRVIGTLMREMDKRFARVRQPTCINFDPIYVLATLLDYRYALLLEGDLLTAAKNELKLLVRSYDDSLASSDHLSDVHSQDPLPTNDLLAAARAKVNEKRRSITPMGLGRELEREIEMYFYDLKRNDEISAANEDCLTFWKNRAMKMPKMYNIAVDVLSIPATSGPCERVFSRASFIFSKNRHNLSDEKLEKEVFYKMNIEFLV